MTSAPPQLTTRAAITAALAEICTETPGALRWLQSPPETLVDMMRGGPKLTLQQQFTVTIIGNQGTYYQEWRDVPVVEEEPTPDPD